MTWLQQELQTAHTQGDTALVFMHSYPDDLRGEGEARAFTNLISAHDVALIDMGHTHYNELAHDGRTIFAATRSTGQIEEGPVGYSIATIDCGVVSWRFKALDDPCPFVVITSPADHRLMRHPGHAIDGSCEVRALVFGARPIKSVACLVEDAWTPMSPAPGERVWTASVSIPTGRLATVTVRAIDETGRPGQHTIQAPTQTFVPPIRERNDSDAASIGVWAENGIMGTQLGPNRNGKPFLV